MPTPLVYRLVANIAPSFVPALLRDPRQQAAHAARVVAPVQLAGWARLHRDRSRPLIWFHASSVGEGLQARAVIEALQRRRPDAQYLYTHYSPSAEQFALSVAANWTGYLAYDRLRDVTALLDAATPDLLVFTKLDLWPELAVQAAHRGSKVAMVAATVNPASSRLHWPVRSLASAGYSVLAGAAAVSTADADRLARLGCARERIIVAGDPRVDSVLRVLDSVADEPPLTTGLDPARTLVAGSTWPGDESVVLAAFAKVRERFPDAALIIAPHEPTPGHLAGIESAAASWRLPTPVRYSTMEPGTMASLVLVDRVGVLARLYASGMAAYVGGGWGTRGIHSVLEPAAWARPVIIGPRDRGSRDAAILHAGGGLVRLRAATGDAELVRQWLAWLEDPATATAAGEAARATLDPEQGAADRSAEMLAKLLS
ncbi:MAG TPA: glycosyltransferase N-terminal domain-containing protein [Gemmatimonadales bacterium]|jgi:3-deoxy-D-manno-octulosonic-acid transferase